MNIEKMTTENFYEQFIKEVIITEFANWAALHLSEDLIYMRDITENKPILTIGDIDGSDTMKAFALCNVVYFSKFKYKAVRYNISGIISTLNNGRIIITSNDVQA